MKVYVVTATDDHMSDDVYGVFSTREFAEECRLTIEEELEYLVCTYIEEVELDAFGHR